MIPLKNDGLFVENSANPLEKQGKMCYNKIVVKAAGNFIDTSNYFAAQNSGAGAPQRLAALEFEFK